MESSITTTQINLKLPSPLMNKAQQYAQDFGYVNIQELIRESLRQKIFDEEYKEEYVKEILETKKQYINNKSSMDALLELAQEAAKYKNAKK